MKFDWHSLKARLITTPPVRHKHQLSHVYQRLKHFWNCIAVVSSSSQKKASDARKPIPDEDGKIFPWSPKGGRKTNTGKATGDCRNNDFHSFRTKIRIIPRRRTVKTESLERPTRRTNTFRRIAAESSSASDIIEPSSCDRIRFHLIVLISTDRNEDDGRLASDPILRHPIRPWGKFYCDLHV